MFQVSLDEFVLYLESFCEVPIVPVFGIIVQAAVDDLCRACFETLAGLEFQSVFRYKPSFLSAVFLLFIGLATCFLDNLLYSRPSLARFFL